VPVQSGSAAEAMALSDRVVVMNRGRVEQIATPQQAYEPPASPFVAHFLGRTNELKGQVSAGVVKIATGSWLKPTAPAGEVTRVVRPEKIALLAPAPDRLSGIVHMRVFRERLRHPGHHRRTATEAGSDAGLRRISQHPRLVAGRGRCCATAGVSPGHVGVKRTHRAALCGGLPMSRNWPLAIAFHAFIVVFMLAPIVVACLVAFTPEGYLSLPVREFSLRWFRAIARYPEFVSAFWKSLWLGALSSALALLVAVPAALAIARSFPRS
jgi:hypothetical protein